MCASGISSRLRSAHNLSRPSTAKTARSPSIVTSTIVPAGIDPIRVFWLAADNERLVAVLKSVLRELDHAGDDGAIGRILHRLAAVLERVALRDHRLRVDLSLLDQRYVARDVAHRVQAALLPGMDCPSEQRQRGPRERDRLQ